MTYMKESPKFDGDNYDNWKNNMRTYLINMGIDYYLITKNEIDIKIESMLSWCTNEKNKLFQYNMIAREALIIVLFELYEGDV